MAEGCKANVDNIKFFKKGLKPLKAYGYKLLQYCAKESISILYTCKKLNKNALKNWFQRL